METIKRYCFVVDTTEGRVEGDLKVVGTGDPTKTIVDYIKKYIPEATIISIGIREIF